MNKSETGHGPSVVLITSDRFGDGDDRLGEILMKAFLNTLWDTESGPESIIFINNGVKLTTQDSEVLDTLKLLEEAGVRLFSCGTCLDYYNLKEKLKVGQVTNMKATVSSLLASDRVISI
jgi:selenium metabolism protein YedF